MGTTLTQLQTGSLSYRYVVAIEGIPYLLTNATASQATTAWSGTDWSAALTNLVVDVQNKSSIDPWSPFTSGGDCRFSIMPDAALGDIIGVMVGRSHAGAATTMTTGLARMTTAMTVASTSAFAAAGNLHIGTECLAYTGKTATTFTGVTRGKYAPFGAGATTRYAHFHEVVIGPNQVAQPPTVAEYPRVWTGRQVGVWMHRVDGSAMDTKAEAQLIFAGKLVDVRDDEETGACCFELEHILDSIKDTLLFKNPYSATIKTGVYIPIGETFRWFDSNGATIKTANDLVAVATPTLSYEMQGDATYTLSELCNKLSEWLAAEKTSGNLHHQYVFVPTFDSPQGTRNQLTMYATGGFGLYAMRGILSPSAALLMGWSDVATAGAGISHDESTSGYYEYLSPFEPLSTALPPFASNATSLAGSTLTIQNQQGSFFEQTATLLDGPDATARSVYPTGWALYLVGGNTVIRALNSGSYLEYVQRASIAFGDDPPVSGLPISDDGTLKVQQIVAMQGTFADLLEMIFFGSGENAYNTANDNGFQGLGIPNALLGDNFTNSLNALGASASSTKIVITKPTKLVTLLGGDLIIRNASLIWKNQGLRFTSFATPSAANALHVLTENNKAEPNASGQRSATSISTSHLKNIVKIEYHRNLNNGEYNKFLTLEDTASIDDYGGSGEAVTISLPHAYNNDDTIERLAADFLAVMPWWSRANILLRRSIAPTHYEDVAAGDIVTITDSFARDPKTGLRGVTARTGVILSHQYSPGGATLGGSTDAMVGEVTIMLGAVDRNSSYAPSAINDGTAMTGGFTQGYDSVNFKLRCLPHQFSNTANDPVDASNFAIGDKIKITTIDALAPSTWLRTVTAISGNDITLNSALTAPAFTSPVIIRSDVYTTAVATQKLDSYQADSATRLISAVAPATVYTLTNDPTPFSLSPHTELPELIPVAASGDGYPVDTATDLIMAHNASWLLDHGMAHNSPMLSPNEISKVSGSGYTSLMYCPIFLGGGYRAGITRYLQVAPFFRSGTGVAVTLRVTLLQNPMTAATLTDPARPWPLSEVSFTTSSTVFAVPTALQLDCSVLGPSGIGWLLIEGTLQTVTRGLAICAELERTI